MRHPRGVLLLAGGLVAFSMPPWGWWPLAFVGCAVYANRATDTDAPFRTAMWWSLGWFVPTLFWMWFLTAPGYLIAAFMFACFHGAAALAAHRIGTAVPRHHRAALVTCHTLAEALRLSFPFGGVPLSTLAISQSRSPLARLSPVGGVILVTFAVFLIAFSSRKVRVAGVVALLCLLSPLVDRTHATGRATYALVQGGGRQGTHAADVKPALVFARHLTATRSITTGAGLTAVIWPENAIDLPRGRKFAGSNELRAVAAEARRLGVPFVVGVTEDGGPSKFLNVQLVVLPDGTVTDRYEKKRRVPFGEYVPFRSVIAATGAPTHMIPRDAEVGTMPAFLDANDVRLATVISWEVFFGGRANEGVEAGGKVILNPTNGASYRTTLLQTQQVASSRLRAREQGRWVMQVAPTGISAFVSPSGRAHDTTRITAQSVITRTVELRSGRTLYSRTGNAPHIWALLLFLALLAWRARGALSRSRS